MTLLLLFFFAADPDVLARANERVVKLYGAGIGRIDAFGSGVLVSPDGHVLTVLTPMVQSDSVLVVLSDGRRRDAKLVGVDPARELAMLKIDGSKLPHFDVTDARSAAVGEVVYALSNQFNVAVGEEAVGVQRGVAAAYSPVAGRVGTREAALLDEMLVLDFVANNPGSAGGAVVDSRGRLLGVLGRELRDPTTETWVHYAHPAASFRSFVSEGMAGRFPAAPASEASSRGRTSRPASLRGVVLLPDVVERLPPYVDSVVAGSPAAKAGVAPDDLVVLVGDRVVQTAEELKREMGRAAPEKPIRLTVRRGSSLLPLELVAEKPKP